MKYNYFIASRWRNKEEVMELSGKIRGKGKSVYNFIEGDGTQYKLKNMEQQYAPEEFMKRFESIPNWQTDPDIQEIYAVDMNALKEAQTLILLLPAGKSAHIEAGAAYGMGKPCVLIGEQKETESLYRIFSEFYPTIDTFIVSL